MLFVVKNVFSVGSVSSVVKKSILRGEKKDFMSDIAIKVRGLGKKYYIGEKLPQRSLAGSIKNAAGFPAAFLCSLKAKS